MGQGNHMEGGIWVVVGSHKKEEDILGQEAAVEQRWGLALQQMDLVALAFSSSSLQLLPPCHAFFCLCLV